MDYPDKNHKDYDPLLTELKDGFDHSSKMMHGSVFGMAGHFSTIREETNELGLSVKVNFFDMPFDSVVPSLFLILGTHRLILQLFGRILQPYMSDFKSWEEEYKYLDGKLDRHMQKWAPEIIERDAARSGRPRKPKGK